MYQVSNKETCVVVKLDSQVGVGFAFLHKNFNCSARKSAGTKIPHPSPHFHTSTYGIHTRKTMMRNIYYATILPNTNQIKSNKRKKKAQKQLNPTMTKRFTRPRRFLTPSFLWTKRSTTDLSRQMAPCGISGPIANLSMEQER